MAQCLNGSIAQWNLPAGNALPNISFIYSFLKVLPGADYRGFLGPGMWFFLERGVLNHRPAYRQAGSWDDTDATDGVACFRPRQICKGIFGWGTKHILFDLRNPCWERIAGSFSGRSGKKSGRHCEPTTKDDLGQLRCMAWQSHVTPSLIPWDCHAAVAASRHPGRSSFAARNDELLLFYFAFLSYRTALRWLQAGSGLEVIFRGGVEYFFSEAAPDFGITFYF